MTRTVTGTIHDPTGDPWPSFALRFVVDPGASTAGATYPYASTDVTTGLDGTFSVDLETDLAYVVELTGAFVVRGSSTTYPRGTRFGIVVPEGETPVTIEELRATSSTPATNVLQTILDAKADASDLASKADAADVTAITPTTPGAAVYATSTGTVSLVMAFPASVWGVVADGATDDTAAINAAITAAHAAGGGEVVLPAGTILASGIRIKDGVTLVVPRGCVLTQKASATTSLIANDDTSNGNSSIGLVVAGVIDGNRANQVQESVSAVAFQFVTDFSIDLRGGTIRNGKQSCINLYTCQRGTVSGGLLTGAGNDNILLQKACANVTVSGVTSTGTVGGLTGSPTCCGFEASDDSRNIAFIGCHAASNLHAGFGVNNHGAPINSTGPFDVTFSGCTAKGNGTSGFFVYCQGANGPSGVTLTACVSEGNTQDGFRVESLVAGLGRVAVNACIARSNGRYGFAFIGAADLAAGSCTATGNTSYGFHVSSAPRVNLQGCLSLGNSLGYNMASSDAILSGCTAQGNTANAGFLVTAAGTGSQLTGCRAVGQTHATEGRGYDVQAQGVQMVGCVATGNTRDGCLIRGTASRCGVNGGRYASNSTYGVRSLTGADYVRVLGVEVISNTTGQISLDAGGANNVTANNVTA